MIRLNISRIKNKGSPCALLGFLHFEPQSKLARRRSGVARASPFEVTRDLLSSALGHKSKSFWTDPLIPLVS